MSWPLVENAMIQIHLFRAITTTLHVHIDRIKDNRQNFNEHMMSQFHVQCKIIGYSTREHT